MYCRPSPYSASPVRTRVRWYVSPKPPRPPYQPRTDDGRQYTAAAKSSALDSTAKSLAALSDVFRKDPKLAQILRAPTLTPGDKSQIVQELQKHMGGVADKADTIKHFMQTLAENNRLAILEGVCEKFATLMGAHRGEMELTITSATVRSNLTGFPASLPHVLTRSPLKSQKLDTKVLQRLETAIAKSEYSQGKKLKVVPKVSRSARFDPCSSRSRFSLAADQPGHSGRPDRRDWGPDHRSGRVVEDQQDEQGLDGCAVVLSSFSMLSRSVLCVSGCSAVLTCEWKHFLNVE